jgi:hypothetical protein
MVVSEGTAQERAVTVKQKTTRALIMLAVTWVGLDLSVARAEPDDPVPVPSRATVAAASATVVSTAIARDGTSAAGVTAGAVPTPSPVTAGTAPAPSPAAAGTVPAFSPGATGPALASSISAVGSAPRPAASSTVSASTAAGSPPASNTSAPATPSPFASEDRWEHAGYNQDEIVYTVFITNHDPNILRCRTEIHGFYFNNGQKGEISDVQVSTVFPDKQVQAGIWSGLDEPSGATYKVTCRAL